MAAIAIPAGILLHTAFKPFLKRFNESKGKNRRSHAQLINIEV